MKTYTESEEDIIVAWQEQAARSDVANAVRLRRLADQLSVIMRQRTVPLAPAHSLFLYDGKFLSGSQVGMRRARRMMMATAEKAGLVKSTTERSMAEPKGRRGPYNKLTDQGV